MILFGEFCKWAADRHIESDVACMSQSEAESARRADEEAAIQKHKEAEFAHLVRAAHLSSRSNSSATQQQQQQQQPQPQPQQPQPQPQPQPQL
jgi:hypothetical protein